MRPIDADAFLKELKKFLVRIHQTYLAEAVLRIVKKVIGEQPTIEAKPVVHAHWDIICDDDDNIKSCYCSNCGVGCEPMNYCGFCGAQMDEK